MHITFTLWFLTDVPTSFHGHQHVFCLQQTKKLGILLNLSSWLSHSDRWSLLLAHHRLPFHGTQHTACSLMTIHVLVINFPFIVQYNLLKQLISWQPSLFRTFQICGGDWLHKLLAPYPTPISLDSQIPGGQRRKANAILLPFQYLFMPLCYCNSAFKMHLSFIVI